MAHPKSELVETCQRLGLGKPKYKTTNTGSQHEPVFVCTVLVAGEAAGTGEGRQKRDAERHAAEAALEFLKNRPTDQDLEVPETRPVTTSTQVDAPFEGPWPIFPEVLAASLHIADKRTGAEQRGPAALDQVRDLALQLYKDVLSDLGDVIEVEDE